MTYSSRAIVALSLVLLTSLSGCGNKQKVEAKKDGAPVQVRAAHVKVRSIQRIVESVGTLFPYDEAIISSEINGPVVTVKADLGDIVQQGTLLAQISDEEQKYLVAQQEAQLRQSLERLGLKNERDRVQDIHQTSDVRRAQADLTEAETNYKRTKQLVDQGIGPKSDLDVAEARFEAARATLDVTLNQTRNLVQEVERFKASLDLQRKRLRDTSITAPFTAYVKERQVTVGQYVQANTAMFTLVKIDPIRLRIEVPERMAPWVKIGQNAEVTVEAFGDRKFEARIWRISPTVDQSKRTFIVEALIQNGRQELKPGSYAKARIQTDKTETIRLLPDRAVNYVLGTNKAYVIKADNTIEARDVTIGDRFPNEVEILNGINDGDVVALGPLNRLDTGSKVTTAPPEQASK